MERKLEKTKSCKRCSVGSSKSMARIMSLESGLRLCRLNHELLPDPGNPMASTTVPFDARGRAAAGTSGTDGADAARAAECVGDASAAGATSAGRAARFG